MAHLTPEQFVDLAEGAQPDTSAPHLLECAMCRRELADLRAMMADAAMTDAGDVPEPSPLFWHQLSSRVRQGVAEETSRRSSWFGWLSRPVFFVPSLAAVMAILIAVVLLPRTPAGPVSTTIPSTPLSLADNATIPETRPSLPPLAPFGAPDDPELRIVAAAATTASWDEMMDEVAASTTGSGDAVAAALTADERRELQRLLAEEVAQPSALEKRS